MTHLRSTQFNYNSTTASPQRHTHPLHVVRLYHPHHLSLQITYLTQF